LSQNNSSKIKYPCKYCNKLIGGKGNLTRHENKCKKIFKID